MKKLLLGTVLLALLMTAPAPTMAGVDVNVSIGLPPLIVFSSPPELIVLPDTYVYVVPDVEAEIFFYDGWWWRPWEGRWYRSHYYDRGWRHYNDVPSFYFSIDPGWRGYYRERNWYGHQWSYERIPHHRVQQNWKSWQNKRHWERQGTWGVQNYKPRPHKEIQELREQRKQHYQQRPEVQKQRQPERKAEQPQRQEQRPEVQKQRQPQEKAEQPQRQEQRPEVQKQRQPREKAEQQRQEQRPEVQKQRQPREKAEQQRQEQRPEVKQQKQQPKEKGKKSQDSHPKEKSERGDDEKRDSR